MRCLITGITGFAGSHLAEYLLSLDVPVFGIIRSHRSNLENINHIKNKLTLYEADLTDRSAVDNVIRNFVGGFLHKEYLIFHLAAQSFVRESFDMPLDTFNNNIIATLNLLESVKSIAPEIKVQIAGSSEEYGFVYHDEIPIKETNPLRPMSPYAVSKCAVDLMGQEYAKRKVNPLYIVVTRGFNHSAARRGEVFAESTFAKQIVERKLGLASGPILVGNLTAHRDITHVKDMVRGYYIALTQCLSGEVYNICSGYTISMQDVLEKLQYAAGFKVNTEIDPSRLRPSDVPILYGSAKKFVDATGWKPEYNIDDICIDLIEYWTEKLSKNLPKIDMVIQTQEAHGG